MKKMNNAGLTLIEVIVALALFASIATPLLGVFSYGLKVERRSLLHSLATYTVQMKLEEAYGMDVDTLIDTYDGNTGVSLASEGLPDLYITSSAVLYNPDPISDPLNPDPLVYGDFSLYQVTITIGSIPYNVHVTMEDIFYAKPSI